MIEIYDWNDQLAINKLQKIIQNSCVAVGSSDTVIGLLAAATQKGREALDFIKKRNAPYLLLVKDMQTARQYSDAFDQEKVAQLTKAFWPGPLTLIVPAKDHVPDYMKSQKGSIAMRMPHHEGLQAILERVGILFSTSANLSGEPIPQTLNELNPVIKKQVEMVIGDPAKKELIPSTILDCTQDPILVVRHGAFSKEDLNGYL